MKKYLCHTDDCCPAVEIVGEHVLIGEGPNMVELTKEQWNILVEKVSNKELTAL